MNPKVARMPLDKPVAFFVFNRPEPTSQVFDAIRDARPRQLLLIADGPRSDRPGEAAQVAAVRELVRRIDWPCEAATNFSEENLGCKKRVASGLQWVFDQVEEAIILEDDCLPSPGFFDWCNELLDRYRDDQRIACINGANALDGNATGDAYHFSKYFHCWGWATWRRVYRQFDASMQAWPSFRDSDQLAKLADHGDELLYWRRIFDAQFAGEIDSWGYPWQFMCWAHGQLSITPQKNLIANIGFGADATHTQRFEEDLANVSVAEFAELTSPQFPIRDKTTDLAMFIKCHLRRTGLRRTMWRIRRRVAQLRGAA